MTFEELWEIFKCCCSAANRSMSQEQIDFILQNRLRCAYFERAMSLIQ